MAHYVPNYMQINNYEAIQLDEEWIILNTDDFTMTKLNAVGGFCWSILEQNQTLPSLVQAVHENYVAVSETIEKDLQEFLFELIQCGLIKYAT